MKALIGIDIGTQGTKAALFLESGECLAAAFRKSTLHRPRPGVVEEEPEDQLDAACHAVKACLREARLDAATVAGIGVDGQMAGVLGIDRQGRHITPYDSWLDTRCAPYIEEMACAAGSEIIRKTGGPPSFNHGPKILWWKHQHPRTYKRIHSFVQPAAYVVMRLCALPGSAAFIDKTYLHFSGFADNRRGKWDKGLCCRFEVDPARLPRIVDPQEVVGDLSASMARRCGLRAGIPVIAGCGDSAASFLACGATRPGIGVDIAGTASVFAATTDSFRPDVRHEVLCCGQAATPGLWHPYAYINGGGLNLEWFRSGICFWKKGRELSAPTLEELDEAARGVKPDEHAPMFVPHLGGRVSPGRPRLRGSWAGLNWQHSAGDLYRAMLEAVALEYRVYQQALASLYPDLQLSELRSTGGGERSRVWNLLKADILQLPVTQVTRPEGAPLGAALLAGHGAGIFPNLREAADRWIHTGKRVRPSSKMAAYYRKRFERYEKLLFLLNQWSHT